MFWAIAIPVYIIGMGAAFTMLGNKYCPRDYWETPIPFFGSLVWPIFLPMLAGGGIGERLAGITSKTTREDKRRTREIEEAEHRLYLAKIEAETTAELEKALR